MVLTEGAATVLGVGVGVVWVGGAMGVGGSKGTGGGTRGIPPALTPIPLQ